MMKQGKWRLALTVLACALFFFSNAQQKLDRTGMNYMIGVKPNNIIYRDSLYMGVKQFSPLFYRTQDPELIRYYKKHQSNKIAGQVLGLTGTLATFLGLRFVTSGDSDKKSAGWILLGSGFAGALTGGYLIFKGQQNLMNAVILFNHKYNQASLGIGIGDRQAGLVLKF